MPSLSNAGGKMAKHEKSWGPDEKHGPVCYWRLGLVPKCHKLRKSFCENRLAA